MAFCFKKKKKAWIWIAVDRNVKNIVEFTTGSRGTETGKKLWDKIREIPCNMYCTDYWKSYKEFLPEEKHIQSKAETFTVEGKNNQLRHYIARFHRKTHCYSKSIEMVENTILLFMNKERVLSMIG